MRVLSFRFDLSQMVQTVIKNRKRNSEDSRETETRIGTRREQRKRKTKIQLRILLDWSQRDRIDHRPARIKPLINYYSRDTTVGTLRGQHEVIKSRARARARQPWRYKFGDPVPIQLFYGWVVRPLKPNHRSRREDWKQHSSHLVCATECNQFMAIKKVRECEFFRLIIII